MRRLVLSFRAILRQGKVATLRRWMRRARASNIHALQRFVRTLRQDLGAVEGAVREPWSNGPVEGHINRLKTLRRQMYGRAGVELLRARTLPFAGAHRVPITQTIRLTSGVRGGNESVARTTTLTPHKAFSPMTSTNFEAEPK
jgi:hypothetical protein